MTIYWALSVSYRYIYFYIVYLLVCITLSFFKSQNEIMNRIDDNDSQIAIMESQKQSSSELAADPNSIVTENTETESGIVNTMRKISNTFAQ